MKIKLLKHMGVMFIALLMTACLDNSNDDNGDVNADAPCVLDSGVLGSCTLQ